jgi:hypothetical protein
MTNIIETKARRRQQHAGRIMVWIERLPGAALPEERKGTGNPFAKRKKLPVP